jgi:hypothetical protein
MKFVSCDSLKRAARATSAVGPKGTFAKLNEVHVRGLTVGRTSDQFNKMLFQLERIHLISLSLAHHDVLQNRQRPSTAYTTETFWNCRTENTVRSDLEIVM